MENPVKIDDLEVSLFLETPILKTIHFGVPLFLDTPIYLGFHDPI